MLSETIEGGILHAFLF